MKVGWEPESRANMQHLTFPWRGPRYLSVLPNGNQSRSGKSVIDPTVGPAFYSLLCGWPAWSWPHHYWRSHPLTPWEWTEEESTTRTSMEGPRELHRTYKILLGIQLQPQLPPWLHGEGFGHGKPAAGKRSWNLGGFRREHCEVWGKCCYERFFQWESWLKLVASFPKATINTPGAVRPRNLQELTILWNQSWWQHRLTKKK